MEGMKGMDQIGRTFRLPQENSLPVGLVKRCHGGLNPQLLQMTGDSVDGNDVAADRAAAERGKEAYTHGHSMTSTRCRMQVENC